MNTSGVRARVDAWGEAQRQGIAGDLCDRIVRERSVPVALLAALAVAPVVPERETPGVVLTAREREIVRYFGSGLRHQDVEAGLGLSPNTVATHKRRIMAKLQARNFAHAYALAYRLGQIA